MTKNSSSRYIHPWDIKATEAPSIEGCRIVRKLGTVRYSAESAQSSAGNKIFRKPPSGLRSLGKSRPSLPIFPTSKPQAKRFDPQSLNKIRRDLRGGKFIGPSFAEQTAAAGAMRQYAAKQGGNAIVSFHWQRENVCVPATTPGRIVRKPYSDYPDPRNYVRSFDRRIQTPSVRRYVDKTRYVFFGKIVKGEKIETTRFRV